MMGADVTLACVPGAINPNERHTHLELLWRLFGDRLLERTARHEPPNGYEFRFNPEAFAELTQSVANERLCCPGHEEHGCQNKARDE